MGSIWQHWVLTGKDINVLHGEAGEMLKDILNLVSATNERILTLFSHLTVNTFGALRTRTRQSSLDSFNQSSRLPARVDITRTSQSQKSRNKWLVSCGLDVLKRWVWIRILTHPWLIFVVCNNLADHLESSASRNTLLLSLKEVSKIRLLVHPPQEKIRSHFNLIQNPGWQFNGI